MALLHRLRASVRQLLGRRAIAQLAEDEIVHGSMMATHQLGKRLPVAPLVADHEHFVRCIALHGRHSKTVARRGEGWGE